MELDDDVLSNVEAGDLPTLAELDAKGLLAGGDESSEEFAERLQKLRDNIQEMESELAEGGGFYISNFELKPDQRIPSEIFTECRPLTEKLYAFGIDWVPGFFVNPSASWLFGGCAFHWYPDFFALFIIRRSFAQKKRWLIYSREELLAHELCHVARIGLDSHAFEETFAYKTGSSRFRRTVGGMFRRPTDVFLLLGSTLLLLGSQVLRTFLWPGLNIEWFWGIVGAVIAYLVVRHISAAFRLRKCLCRLKTIAPDNALPITFRCTDQEIAEIAQQNDQQLQDWIQTKSEHNLRWQVIRYRFILNRAV